MSSSEALDLLAPRARQRWAAHPRAQVRLWPLFRDHSLAAFGLLLAFKIALALNQVIGTEAYAGLGNILGKLPLLLGWDVVGALLVGALITTLSLFTGRSRGPTLLIGTLIQSVHGFFVSAGFFASLVLGGPLTKVVFDLATLQEKATQVDSAALSSSIGRYLTGSTFGVVGTSTLVGLLSPWIAAWIYSGLAPIVRRVGAIFLGLLAVTTVAVLPQLTNGQWWGIRVHTYGLERSPVVEFGWSYASPLLQRAFSNKARGQADFYFDLSTDSHRLDPQPLLAAQPKRTHIVYVSLESVGATYMQDGQAMPFLSGLHRRPGGVALSQHYTTWPQTMKAFFSLFCAELPYPAYQTISTVNPTIPCVSISEALHQAGWHTSLVTSADLGYDRKMRFFRHRAFDHVVDMHSLPDREKYWSNSWGVDEKAAVAHILDLFDEPSEAPRFIFYELFTAHHPYDATAEHANEPLDDRAAYMRALRYIDDRMRDLVEGINARGLAQETLFVFFADHGEGFGQHPGSLSHGPKVYQEAVWVPAIFYGPQLAEISGALESPTSHIDLAPTVLGLVDVPVPCTMKGRDLTESDEPQIVLFGGRPPNGQLGLVDGPWKYILNENGQEELYDLTQDPGETRDLSRHHSERARAYRARLEAWVESSTDLVANYAQRLSESSCQLGQSRPRKQAPPGRLENPTKTAPGHPEDAAKAPPGRLEDAAKAAPGRPEETPETAPGRPEEAPETAPGRPEEAPETVPSRPEEATETPPRP